MWRLLRDFVIAVVLTAWRRWKSLFFRPWESALLIATSPVNFWRTGSLLVDLLGRGLAIATPPGEDAAVLRTIIIGPGDLTTRVEEAKLTPALVTAHASAVRARLAPLTAAPEALARISALVMVAGTTYWNRAQFTVQGLPQLAIQLIPSAFVVSFVWIVVTRLLWLLVSRAVRRWLDRAR